MNLFSYFITFYRETRFRKSKAINYFLNVYFVEVVDG